MMLKRRKTSRSIHCAGLLISASLLTPACQSTIIKHADREVYRVIEDRQRAALGATSDVNIGPEAGEVSGAERMYSFNPRPTDSEIPESFRRPRAEEPGPLSDQPVRDNSNAQPQETSRSAASDNLPQNRVNPPSPFGDESKNGTGSKSDSSAGGASPGSTPSSATQPAASAAPEPEAAPLSASIFTQDQQAQVKVFDLSDALAYADHHARDVQDAKEDLFIAALALTLERHLWTPQFVASVQAEFADYGQVRDFDRAMTAVSNVAVTQKLPYGGQVTARIINNLMRDLGMHTTSGESGNIILEANIPLFRGAGRVAYESRYQAERDLIYAVRTYERFRRSFLVDAASRYFSLQQLKSAIENTNKSYESRKRDWEKADFINRMGQAKTIFEAPRAKSSFRQAEAALVSAKEQYASALDRFKIFVGMPVDELLDVLDQDADADAKALDDLLPEVDVATALDVALRYRLDLLNDADHVDDARRGVLVARNSLLPDLNASGSATMDTDATRLNSVSYNTERTTWVGMLELRMDDRKKERNAYRAALIATRKAERNHERSADTVRADVRRAIRRVGQQAKLREIQAANVEENEFRLKAARAQFDLGTTTNRDVVDAENDLLAARNELAGAIASYRVSILEFRRDTETLRVTDDGNWIRPQPPEPGDEELKRH